MTKQAKHAKPDDRIVACVAPWLADERKQEDQSMGFAPRTWRRQHVDSIAARSDVGGRPLLSLKIGIIQGDRVS